MKRILGLDLGSSSIGWAVVDENSREVTDERDQPLADRIVGIGSRIVPLTTDENAQFTKGQALTKNADRTRSRSQRKGYDRYQLRRSLLWIDSWRPPACTMVRHCICPLWNFGGCVHGL